MPGTLLARLGRMMEIVCRVDPRNVRERLRKVAEQAPSAIADNARLTMKEITLRKAIARG
jgi:hypothetical protein